MQALSKKDLTLILCRRFFRKMSGSSALSWKGRKRAGVGSHDRKSLFHKGAEVEGLCLQGERQMVVPRRNRSKLVWSAEGTGKKVAAAVKIELSAKDKTTKPWVPEPEHPGKRKYEKRKKHKQRPEGRCFLIVIKRPSFLP